MELAKSGASFVRGVDTREDAIATAITQWRNTPGVHDKHLRFHVGDASTFDPRSTAAAGFDIIIMLAVLHKLKNPTAACARLVAHAHDLVVIRLPPEHAPTIIDERSGNEPHHIDATMERSGFALEHAACDGPFGEWVGYYRRVRA
jgi:hypothetical protein